MMWKKTNLNKHIRFILHSKHPDIAGDVDLIDPADWDERQIHEFAYQYGHELANGSPPLVWPRIWIEVDDKPNAKIEEVIEILCAIVGGSDDVKRDVKILLQDLLNYTHNEAK